MEAKEIEKIKQKRQIIESIGHVLAGQRGVSIDKFNKVIDMFDKYVDKYVEQYADHSQQSQKPNKTEGEILEATKEFAKSNDIHYDDMTENMILNAMREVNAQQSQQTVSDLKELRGKFFKECTIKQNEQSLSKIDLAPHDMFEWFKRNIPLVSQKTDLKIGQKLFDALGDVCDFTALESDMREIIIAVKKDNAATRLEVDKDYTNNLSFWKRLKDFVGNVEVGDAMSEEEKGMILNICDNKIQGKSHKPNEDAECKCIEACSCGAIQ